MWIALVALIAGVIVGYTKAPHIEFSRVLKRGLEPNLVLYKLPIEEIGRAIALVAALALSDAAAGAFGRARATGDAPDPTDALRWFAASIATSVYCLFGPKYYDPTLVPATCMVAIAALPYLVWLATSPLVRYATIATAVIVHAIVWPLALVRYHGFGEEGAARLAAITATPPNSIARITPYSRVLSSFWFFGEDLFTAQLRQEVAIEVFGVRDLVMTAPFRKLEKNPDVKLALEVDGASADEVRAAAPPVVWAGVPAVAREQFELFVDRLHAVVGRAVSARLVVEGVAFAQRGARPLYAAWADRSGAMFPRTAISSLDENNEYTVRMYGDEVKRFDEAWIVDGDEARKTPYRNGSPRVRPQLARLQVVVFCNAERCLLEDAFVPRLQQ
jgi:hypothetical protein